MPHRDRNATGSGQFTFGRLLFAFTALSPIFAAMAGAFGEPIQAVVWGAGLFVLFVMIHVLIAAAGMLPIVLALFALTSAMTAISEAYQKRRRPSRSDASVSL